MKLTRRQILKYSLAFWASAHLCRDSAAWAASVTDPTAAPPAKLTAQQVARKLTKLRARAQRISPPTPQVVAAMQRFPSSVLMYDLAQVEENYLSFLEADARAEVYYAVKCCPNPRVMQRVAALGGGFDFASRAELDLALATGVDVRKCIYSNTVKPEQDLQYAYWKGVRAFLADSEHEVRKIAAHAPGSMLYLRLSVDSKLAAHPLGDKFGTTPENAKKLLRLGKELGLVPFGTHFHVGTQCVHPEAWIGPAREAAGIFRDLASEGIFLKFFDIGGGFPAAYLNYPNAPGPSKILPGVRAILEKELPGLDVRLALEPGRGIAATAGAVGSRVLLRAPRATGEWLHLDAGLYHGMIDVMDGYVYHITIPGRTGDLKPFTLSGPTCDSADVISKGQLLPGDIDEGDYFVFHDSAAYSEACDTEFNGMASPVSHYLDEVLDLDES